MEKYNISIGAGHGGKDSGAVGPTGLLEKDVNLAIAKKLAGLLSGAGAFNILQIRKADEYIDINERGKMAAEFGSKCHIEIHVNGYNGKASYAAVWYSRDIPRDQKYADQMARLTAQALSVPDGGGRIRCSGSREGNREDYCSEDYYGMIDSAAEKGISHVFMPECGFIDYLPTEKKLRQEIYIDAIADAIASTVCELFSVAYPYAPVSPPKTVRYVQLKKGGFYIRSGPGNNYSAVTTVIGGVQLPVTAQSNGWFKVTVNGKQGFLGPGAVSNVVNVSEKPDAVAPVQVETVKGNNTAYSVREKAELTAAAIGVVHGGEKWQTETVTGGFRKIPYGGKIGFVAPAAWES